MLEFCYQIVYSDVVDESILDDVVSSIRDLIAYLEDMEDLRKCEDTAYAVAEIIESDP